MPRYLNPAKICLLGLIELYVDQAVPTDAVLPVLSFITSHVLGRDSTDASSGPDTRWSRAERTFSIVIAINDFENLLASYPLLTGIPGRKLWDQFLKRIWDVNSLDAINDFFDRITGILRGDKQQQERDDEGNKVRLWRNSPFGAFIRRCRLQYERLAFHGRAELWKAFVSYRQPTAHYLTRTQSHFEKLSFDNVLLLGREEWNLEGVSALAAVAYGDMLAGHETGTLAVSTNDVGKILQFQVKQMQRYGVRVPLEMQHQFHDLLHDSARIPSLSYYLSFLDAWKSGDYTTAFDFLHRYFDSVRYRKRQSYQYALINLAVLQSDFGCYREAVVAMLETVTTARENRDLTCLNFALNWLFHFGREHPSLVRDLKSDDSPLATDQDSLAFLRISAKESGMWSLWSSVLLSDASEGLANGDSVATALESMVRSSQAIVERNMKTMFGSQMALYAALWRRLGLTHLSTLTSDIFLRCHARHAVFDEQLKHTCLLAMRLSERGRYDEGLHLLEQLDENSLRSWKAGQHWHKYRAIVRLQRDLRHNNLSGAEELLNQLLQYTKDHPEPYLSFTIDSLHVDCLVRRGDVQTAFQKVQDMSCTLQSDKKKDIAMRVALLLKKVSLLDKCGRPQRAFSTAIRATNMALRARLVPSLWQAVGALSNILVSLSEFKAASELLEAVLPRALETDSAALAAQLYSFLADAYMGLAGKTESGTYMTWALWAVQKSFDLYSAVQDIEKQCEMMAKKATIMKLSGEMALAADYAAAYVELRKTAELLSLGR